MTDTLHLDQRQRAMLAEMGVRVWSPLSETPVMDAAVVEIEQPHGFVAAGELATQAIADAIKPAPILIQRPDGIDQMDWSTLHTTVSGCQACSLCSSRQHTVFGVGAPAADGQAPQVDWLIVGETPGEEEDLQGKPFVGQVGQLLDNMLGAMKLSRTGARTAEGGGVYIANVLKCRPPGNRNPKPEEVAQCLPYLERQVALLKPKMIVAMGRFAVQALLRDSVPELEGTPYGKLRGRVYQYQNVPVVVTYHPAYVLRNLSEKAKVWADLCLAMAHLKGSE
ncbi:uracil-DNA glycosylase [Limnohabitans sp.]|uniref:uracil-DNA glycosylase n=1 Tax=Limnohabitans sp. TaxID=1907725 RepID=UPI002FDE0F69